MPISQWGLMFATAEVKFYEAEYHYDEMEDSTLCFNLECGRILDLGFPDFWNYSADENILNNVHEDSMIMEAAFSERTY